LKIIIIGPAFPLRGGIADFNEALAKSLSEQGDDVSLYSFYYQYPKILFPGTSQFSEGKSPEQLSIKSTLSSINPFSWFKTASLIAGEKPDLVIIRYWLPFMAPALGTVSRWLRKKKIPVIAITDNIIPHEKRPGDKQLTQYFINQCDGFITMSREVLQQLSLFTTTEKKAFLPHPVYNIFGDAIRKVDARKNLLLSADDKIVLFFGFIRSYKGLQMLLDAMSDERIRNRKIKLLVAGEFYEDDKPYHEKIENLNLKQSVILHTVFIDKERVKDYFCAADMVIQPYLSATQSGITQIAYHFERPMLVTNVGGLAEIVSDKRVGYVTESNPTSIADAICDFYDNGREGIFSKNAAADKENFTWNAFITGLKKLKESLNK
jgi:glycosyltransferase involved in cell wall biosynthesis